MPVSKTLMKFKRAKGYPRIPYPKSLNLVDGEIYVVQKDSADDYLYSINGWSVATNDFVELTAIEKLRYYNRRSRERKESAV